MNNSEVPVMQVYSQQEFINQREADVKKLNEYYILILSDAKTIHGIAGQMNEKIYEGDDKFDKINKNNTNQIQDIKKANSELEQARELTNKRNKTIMCCTLFAVLLMCILGTSVYFMFFYDQN